jgi:hypothetical protein
VSTKPKDKSKEKTPPHGPDPSEQTGSEDQRFAEFSVEDALAATPPLDAAAQALLATLKKEILQGLWVDLRDHAERGAIFMIPPDLILSDVGLALAQDNTVQIEGWIKAGELSRPTPAQIKKWDLTPERQFQFLIIQPYVLIQELGH